MARPTERKRHRLSQAVIDLRASLGDTQQRFAARLGTAVATIARYETSRPPSGVVLANLAAVAQQAGRDDLVREFMAALGAELRFGEIKGGTFEFDMGGENPRGYLLLNIEGRQARAYAQVFFRTFQRFVAGSAEEKEQAKDLLDNFCNVALEEWTKP